MAVGLVVVSHSAALARGVVEVAGQMAPDVTISSAGGTDDGGIGTSLERVMAALAEADAGDGVVVLYDLGSAQMTAEAALEFLDEHQRERVRVVDAPLVEGAIAAATAAAGGADVLAVAAAAADLWGRSEDPAASGAEDESQGLEWVVTLRNPEGLHARPAAQFARALRGLNAEVRVERLDTGAGADGRSVLSLVALAAPVGTQLRLVATGADAERALAVAAGVVATDAGSNQAPSG